MTERSSVTTHPLSPGRALGLATLFLLGQLGFTVALAPGPERYVRLNNWDSLHYLDILERGYRLPPEIEERIARGERPSSWLSQLTPYDVHRNDANLGYFPAYPLASRGVRDVLGIPSRVALVLTSQLFAWVFWAYALVGLGLWGLEARVAARAGLLILAFPTAFFLVVGYSESLFLAAFLGLALWTELALRAQERRRDLPALGCWSLAALHGVVLSATRLVGLPMVIYPALRAWGPALVGAGKKSEKPGPGARLASLLVSFLSAAGGIGYFVWCRWRFGAWDLYLKLQELGWGNNPDYLVLLKPGSYLPRFFFEDTMTSISRLSVPVCLALLARVAWQDLRRNGRTGLGARLALYTAAFLAFYVSAAGKANASMDSMSRYTFPVYVAVLLAWSWARAPGGIGLEWKPRTWLAAAALLALQTWMAWMFLRGHWVA